VEEEIYEASGHGYINVGEEQVISSLAQLIERRQIWRTVPPTNTPTKEGVDSLPV